MKKSRDSDSGLVQQLPLSVSAAAEDLAPQVEGGGGGGEHDEKLLLQTEAAHSRGGVVAARPGFRFRNKKKKVSRNKRNDKKCLEI